MSVKRTVSVYNLKEVDISAARVKENFHEASPQDELNLSVVGY